MNSKSPSRKVLSEYVLISSSLLILLQFIYDRYYSQKELWVVINFHRSYNWTKLLMRQDSDESSTLKPKVYFIDKSKCYFSESLLTLFQPLAYTFLTH